MVVRVLLTEKRKDVLNGSFDGSEGALRVQKFRLRERSQTALEELVEVAESHEIDTQEVFDPDTVYQLLLSILRTPEYTHPVEGVKDDPQDYQDYQDRIISRMAQLIALQNPDLEADPNPDSYQ